MAANGFVAQAPRGNQVLIGGFIGGVVDSRNLDHRIGGVPQERSTSRDHYPDLVKNRVNLSAYNTTMTNGSGRLTLNYGPGASTIVEVRMNELGNTNLGTAWEYTISSYNTANSFLIFTEDTANTNKNPVPVKFAPETTMRPW